MLVAEMRKRISAADRVEIIHQIAALPVSLDQPHQPIDLLSVCDIARKHALSVYDACYMQLAGSRRIPLAAFDRQLRAAAQRCGVPTLP
ncbi:MAG TPA: type II toxin-antitoxin system VapC family toxin [Casimicrobiaceae bacterium]